MGLRKDKADKDCLYRLLMSGYQDSNLGPPAPKAGALTGLRYTPFSQMRCKGTTYFGISKYLLEKLSKEFIFFLL